MNALCTPSHRSRRLARDAEREKGRGRLCCSPAASREIVGGSIRQLDLAFSPSGRSGCSLNAVQRARSSLCVEGRATAGQLLLFCSFAEAVGGIINIVLVPFTAS